MNSRNGRLVPAGISAVENSQFAFYPTDGLKVTGTINADRTLILPKAETTAYAFAIEAEVAFLNSKGANLALLDQSVQDVHGTIVARHLGHLGLRDISLVDGEVRVGQVTVVPYPLYQLCNRAENPVVQTAGANCGSCVVLLTTEVDGTHKIVIQERGPKNRVYGGNIPGASAAGLINGKLLRNARNGEVVDLVRIAEENVREESLEEIAAKLGYLLFSGIVLDKWAVHHEFIFLGVLEMTFDELRQRALSADTGQTLTAFRENFFGLPATTENLLKLTEALSPMPPTHWAAFAAQYVALGGDLKHYVDAIETGGERINAICPGGAYNPNEAATAQGLPSIYTEFVRLFGADGFEYVKVV